MIRTSSRGRVAAPQLRLSFGVALACAAIGCNGGSGGNASSTSSAGEQSTASPTPSASTSAAAAPVVPAPAPPGEPQGTGYATVVKAKDKASGCKANDFEVAQYLQRGELTLAGRPGPGSVGDKPEFAASWLIQLRGHSQIAFAGYDQRARRVGKDQGIGSAREHAPQLFATADQWTVAWYDQTGLAYAHPIIGDKELPAIDHLGAAKSVDPTDVALATTPEGSLVVASYIGTNNKEQLSLFVFAPAKGKQARAIGITKHANKPRDPAVVADEGGYTVAWMEDDNRIVATRFDPKGDEKDAGAIIVKGAEKRDHLQLTPVQGGALITWMDGDTFLVRKLDENAKPVSDIFVIGKGHDPAIVSAGSDAIAAILAPVSEEQLETGAGKDKKKDDKKPDERKPAKPDPKKKANDKKDEDKKDDKKPAKKAETPLDQLVVVGIGHDAKVAPRAVQISDGGKAVLDPPAIAIGGERFAAVWTEVMSAAISSKRAWLRIVDLTCLR